MARISNPSRAPAASAPARTTRRTRSQSAEPVATAPQPATTTGSRRRGKASSRAGSEQPEDGRRKTSAAPVADLTTVEEHEDDREDDDAQLQAHILRQSQTAEDLLDADEAHVARNVARRRISTGSAISGTTAKTSFSAEEIEQMDPDIMIDDLPALATTAHDFSTLLAPDGSETSPATWKEIRSAGSKLSKRYNNRHTQFNTLKSHFGSQEYIRPRTVVRALLGVQSVDEVPNALWRPDNILFKANLAEMLNTVLVECDTDEWTPTGSDALERLHAAFPQAIAGSEFNFDTLSFYLDLTAQLTMRRMDASIESEPNFVPQSVVDNLFYDDDDTFRHIEELGLMDISEADRDSALEYIKQTVAELKQPFKGTRNGAGATAANGKLKAKFRWDFLKMHTLKYYEARVSQLDKRIDRVGGVSQIVRLLTREVERRQMQRHADQLRRQSNHKHGSTPRASLAGIAALKQLEDTLMDNDSASEEEEAVPDQEPAAEDQSAPEEEAAVEDDPARDDFLPKPMEPDADQRANIIEHDFAHSSNASSRPAVQPAKGSDLSIAMSFQDRQYKRQQKSPRRPRGRFIDPQPNAVRLEWNEDELSQANDHRPAQRGSRTPQSANKGKRTRTEMEDNDDDGDEEDIPNPTQDEGFQTDTRDLAAADQRRKEAAAAQRNRPPARYSSIDPAIGAPGPSNYASSTTSEARPSPSKRQRLNPGSSVMPTTQPAPDGNDLSTAESYARSKIYARQHSAVNSMRKPQQQRRPWSEAEEEALMKLIEEHGSDGISYAGLKNLDAALGDEAKLSQRTAEDIRFKARNMKSTMLVGGFTQENLPKNWEHVMLDKKAVERIQSKGVKYVQERQRNLEY